MLLRGLTCIFLITITLLLPTRTHACFMYEGLRKATSSHPIASGTIIDVHCRWNKKNTKIETVLSIQMDSLSDDSAGEILYSVVPGGVLPEEGINLVVTGQDQFRIGEQVAVFSGGNSNYAVKKSYGDYPLEGKVTDNLAEGFTHYCYNDDTLNLACSSDVCELGVSWPRESIPLTYYVNSSFSPYQIEAIETAMETWNSVNSLFRGINGGLTELNKVAPDGMNVIRFADEEEIPDYQLACCHIWTNLDGEIFDADISLNPRYDWGVMGSPGECDIQNILTHEIGHFIGLGDIYETGERLFMTCMGEGNKENTMYGFSGRGETKKRTLALGDFIGIQSIYGCAVTIALEGDDRAINSIRDFVNSFLIKTKWGKDFINFYYEISPQLSRVFIDDPKMKLRTKKIINGILPVIETLSSLKNPSSKMRE